MRRMFFFVFLFFYFSKKYVQTKKCFNLKKKIVILSGMAGVTGVWGLTPGGRGQKTIGVGKILGVWSQNWGSWGS